MVKISEIILESVTNSISLRDLYNGDFPDRDELFWEYVRPGEVDTPLTIHQLSAAELKIMLLSQYRAKNLGKILGMIDGDRTGLITQYQNDPSLSNKVVVVCDDLIIDGNHRALAAALGNKPINYIDLADLEE